MMCMLAGLLFVIAMMIGWLDYLLMDECSIVSSYDVVRALPAPFTSFLYVITSIISIRKSMY